MRRLAVPACLIVLAAVLGLWVLGPRQVRVTVPEGGTPSLASSVTPAVAPGVLDHGRTLFDETCSSCHGILAQGSSLAPPLQGVGAATVDLWITSGWMPLSVPTAQPIKKPDKFDRPDTTAIADYVASIAPGGPAIPQVDLAGASVSEGFDLFSLNCAPCHTITGAGDALSNGLSAPPLHGLTATQVTEAIETGPDNMPRMEPGALTPAEAKDVVAYVTRYIEHPVNPGGVGLGGVGPVAEGFIGLFIGVGACVLLALWVGDRAEKDHDAHGEGDEHTEASHV